jgi:peptide/nickel transport system ATP-binding protein
VEVENLNVDYRTGGGLRRVVDGVSFRLERGSALGLVGESGCGKTTIGMALMGLLPPKAAVVSGQVRFEGENLLSVGDKRLRQIRWRHISMIFQAAMNALNPVQRIQDQITEAIVTHEPDLSKHAVAHRVRSLFELVKIPGHRLNDYPHQFSGGMRQRVIIAMALACNPSLIIADEPTTALDVIVQSQILDAIATFQREMNIGMIFISHDIAVVADVCNQIGVMHAGRLVEVGRREEVLDCPAHPYTRMLVGSQLTLSDQAADLSGDALIPADRPSAAESACTISHFCPVVAGVCRRDGAVWVDLSATHQVRCSRARKER